VIQLLLKLALLVIAFKAIRSLFGRSRPRSRSRFSPKSDTDRGITPDYSDFTPYDIEDADYEDVPEKKD
jgi:hypothetical protein